MIMDATLFRDGAAALDLGGVAESGGDYTTARGGLLVPAHAATSSEVASAEPALASVRTLHPDTITGDTDELPAVCGEDRMTAASDAEPGAEGAVTVPAQAEPQPEPKPESQPVPGSVSPVSEPKPEPESAPPAPARETNPPDPAGESEFSPFPMERFYPIIYWTSVLIGLVSQVIGWGTVFGGGPQAYVAAAIVGGICELTMVTTSDKGLNWAAQNRTVGEFLPFLLVATVAAVVAVYMVTTHWHGTLGVYLGMVSAAGFLGHMLDGGFKAKRARRVVQARESAAEAAAAAQRRAAEQARAEQDAAEAERARVAAADAALAAAQQRTAVPRQTAKSTSTGSGSSKRSGSAKARANRQIAIQVGKRDLARTPAALREALDRAGYAPAGERAVKAWCAAIREELDTAI